eukprot:Clim_evm90s149 gene=Clim_evmTU90s149
MSSFVGVTGPFLKEAKVLPITWDGTVRLPASSCDAVSINVCTKSEANRWISSSTAPTRAFLRCDKTVCVPGKKVPIYCVIAYRHTVCQIPLPEISQVIIPPNAEHYAKSLEVEDTLILSIEEEFYQELYRTATVGLSQLKKWLDSIAMNVNLIERPLTKDQFHEELCRRPYLVRLNGSDVFLHRLSDDVGVTDDGRPVVRTVIAAFNFQSALFITMNYDGGTAVETADRAAQLNDPNDATGLTTMSAHETSEENKTMMVHTVKSFEEAIMKFMEVNPETVEDDVFFSLFGYDIASIRMAKDSEEIKELHDGWIVKYLRVLGATPTIADHLFALSIIYRSVCVAQDLSILDDEKIGMEFYKVLFNGIRSSHVMQDPCSMRVVEDMFKFLVRSKTSIRDRLADLSIAAVRGELHSAIPCGPLLLLISQIALFDAQFATILSESDLLEVLIQTYRRNCHDQVRTEALIRDPDRFAPDEPSYSNNDNSAVVKEKPAVSDKKAAKQAKKNAKKSKKGGVNDVPNGWKANEGKDVETVSPDETPRRDPAQTNELRFTDPTPMVLQTPRHAVQNRVSAARKLASFTPVTEAGVEDETIVVNLPVGAGGGVDSTTVTPRSPRHFDDGNDRKQYDTKRNYPSRMRRSWAFASWRRRSYSSDRGGEPRDQNQSETVDIGDVTLTSTVVGGQKSASQRLMNLAKSSAESAVTGDLSAMINIVRSTNQRQDSYEDAKIPNLLDSNLVSDDFCLYETLYGSEEADYAMGSFFEERRYRVLQAPILRMIGALLYVRNNEQLLLHSRAIGNLAFSELKHLLIEDSFAHQQAYWTKPMKREFYRILRTLAVPLENSQIDLAQHSSSSAFAIEKQKQKADAFLWRLVHSLQFLAKFYDENAFDVKMETYIVSNLVCAVQMLTEYISACSSAFVTDMVIQSTLLSVVKIRDKVLISTPGRMILDASMEIVYRYRTLKHIHLYDAILRYFTALMRYSKKPELDVHLTKICLDAADSFEVFESYTNVLFKSSLMAIFCSKEVLKGMRLALLDFLCCMASVVTYGKADAVTYQAPYCWSGLGRFSSGYDPESAFNEKNMARQPVVPSQDMLSILQRLQFLLNPSKGLFLELLERSAVSHEQSRRPTTAGADRSRSGLGDGPPLSLDLQLSILNFMAAVARIPNSPFMETSNYVDAYITFHYVNFVKLYHSDSWTEDCYRLCVAHLRVLISFATCICRCKKCLNRDGVTGANAMANEAKAKVSLKPSKLEDLIAEQTPKTTDNCRRSWIESKFFQLGIVRFLTDELNLETITALEDDGPEDDLMSLAPEGTAFAMHPQFDDIKEGTEFVFAQETPEFETSVPDLDRRPSDLSPKLDRASESGLLTVSGEESLPEIDDGGEGRSGGFVPPLSGLPLRGVSPRSSINDDRAINSTIFEVGTQSPRSMGGSPRRSLSPARSRSPRYLSRSPRNQVHRQSPKTVGSGLPNLPPLRQGSMDTQMESSKLPPLAFNRLQSMPMKAPPLRLGGLADKERDRSVTRGAPLVRSYTVDADDRGQADFGLGTPFRNGARSHRNSCSIEDSGIDEKPTGFSFNSEFTRAAPMALPRSGIYASSSSDEDEDEADITMASLQQDHPDLFVGVGEDPVRRNSAISVGENNVFSRTFTVNSEGGELRGVRDVASTSFNTGSFSPTRSLKLKTNTFQHTMSDADYLTESQPVTGFRNSLSGTGGNIPPLRLSRADSAVSEVKAGEETSPGKRRSFHDPRRGRGLASLVTDSSRNANRMSASILSNDSQDFDAPFLASNSFRRTSNLRMSGGRPMRISMVRSVSSFVESQYFDDSRYSFDASAMLGTSGLGEGLDGSVQQPTELGYLERRIDVNNPKFQLVLDKPAKRPFQSAAMLHFGMCHGDMDDPITYYVKDPRTLYLTERENRKLYSNEELQISMVVLTLALLVRQDETLDPNYSDTYPLEKQKPNAPFILYKHLNHPKNAELSHRIYQRVKQNLNPGHNRYVRLLLENCFCPDMLVESIQLATGAYGTVFLSRMARISDDAWASSDFVANKRLEIPKHIQDRCVFADAYNEINILESLAYNPRVTHLYDFGLANGHIMIVMNFMKKSLRAWREQQQRPFREMMLSYFLIYEAVLDAVGFLSFSRVNHYDIKCDNVLLYEIPEDISEINAAGSVGESTLISIALADFGEAVKYGLDAEGYTMDNRGTDFIKSPEMLNIATVAKQDKDGDSTNGPQGADKASDVWSVVCLFYELLVGQFLFLDHDWIRFFLRVTSEGEELITRERGLRIMHLCKQGPEAPEGLKISENASRYILRFLKKNLIRDPKKRPDIMMVIEDFRRLFTYVFPQFERPIRRRDIIVADDKWLRGENRDIQARFTRTHDEFNLKTGQLKNVFSSAPETLPKCEVFNSVNQQWGVTVTDCVKSDAPIHPEHIDDITSGLFITRYFYFIDNDSDMIEWQQEMKSFGITHVLDLYGDSRIDLSRQFHVFDIGDFADGDEEDDNDVLLGRTPASTLLFGGGFVKPASPLPKDFIEIGMTYLTGAINQGGKVVIFDTEEGPGISLCLAYLVRRYSWNIYTAMLHIQRCTSLITDSTKAMADAQTWALEEQNFRQENLRKNIYQCLCGNCVMYVDAEVKINVFACRCPYYRRNSMGERVLHVCAYGNCLNFLNVMSNMYGYDTDQVEWLEVDDDELEIRDDTFQEILPPTNNGWIMHRCRTCLFLTYGTDREGRNLVITNINAKCGTPHNLLKTRKVSPALANAG